MKDVVACDIIHIQRVEFIHLNLLIQLDTLNLTINQSDTSFTEITACDNYQWNGEIYTESGEFYYTEENINEYSMSFDGINDRISIPHNSTFNIPKMSVLVKVLPNSFGPSEQYN